MFRINDLDVGIKNSLLKFADDTKVFGKISDPTGHFLLQDDINQLVEWSTDWQMLFNVDKCKVMHFGTRTHQEMRDSEREPFYDDIARTYFKIQKKIIPPVRFEPETVNHLAT